MNTDFAKCYYCAVVTKDLHKFCQNGKQVPGTDKKIICHCKKCGLS